MMEEALKGQVNNVLKIQIIYMACFISVVSTIILSDSNTFFHFFLA